MSSFDTKCDDCEDCIHWDQKWRECKNSNPSLDCHDYEPTPDSEKELEKLKIMESIKLNSWDFKVCKQ